MGFNKFVYIEDNRATYMFREIIKDVLAALRYLHANQIFHGNLTIENVAVMLVRNIDHMLVDHPMEFVKSSDKLVVKLMGITRQENAYDAYCSDVNSGKGEGREIMVQHLLLKEDNLKLLLELQQRIARGGDLSDLAVEYSICPSKQQGGMLGWVQKGRMVPEFEKAAFDAPLNKPVRCKTKFGLHILQVLSEREAALQDIEPEELHLKMQDPSFLEDAQLIDVRELNEIEQVSLPNLQVYPLRQFGSWASEIITKLDPQKDTYVLCHHGVRSLQVAKWLQTQGFTRIFNASGGIHAYAVKVDPSVPTY